MARGRIEVLEKDEIDRIDAISIRILSELGVSIHSEKVCHMLEDEGCVRSKDRDRILIPEDVVRSAVSNRAGKTVFLASRDKKHDISIPCGRTFMANGGEAVYVKNLITGKRHPSTIEDVIDFTVLADRLPQVDFLWTMSGATEQSPHLKELLEQRISLEYSTKHYQGGALTAEQAKDMVDVASVLSGGAKELDRRPIFSAIQCPISPLTFEGGVAEAQVELARAGIPVVAMSAPIAGITSPVTLSGTIAQTNAENLASLVISQAGKKGAPFVYSSDSSPADMKTGSIDYGGIESPLMHVGCGQMGRHYGLPTMAAGATVAEASMLLGTVQEGVPLMMLEALNRSDLGSAFGGIDNALGASLEQMVADAWIWEYAREFGRDFRADMDAISFETIRTVVKGGSYLGQPHTMKNFRKENLAAARPEMGSPERDVPGNRGALIKKARTEAERILKEPRKKSVTEDESKKLDALFLRFMHPTI
jgi:trimethylamine--corrinoid protein Co-methyltransferase